MRALTPAEGKKAIILDCVNNIQKHGPLTMDREWSLEKKVPDYYNEDDKGNFIIRVCQNCFSTFEKANVCPYCGAEYQTTQVEIQNYKEIELKKIEEEKETKRQAFMKRTADKVKDYSNVNQCKTFYELVEFGKARNYKPGWAVFQAKRLHLMK